ncbi:MAG: class I SAM-dependent methyltransferase [Deltaproteobacteria bacterium]|nr:class I SAM-dependent methyltransferase [Deltaproteobacteria bacterium]
MNDFSERINEILNHGALNLAMAIGYKNRIFDILEDLNKPVTVLEIASASGLNDRYLKEWLGIMVTGKIIEISHAPDGEDTYFLPPEHASFLTRKAGNNNMGVYTQEIPLLTSCALESVNRGFNAGDGIPFSRYPDFQKFMAELSDAKHQTVLVDKFLPSVDNRQLLSRLTDGIRVCDLGCGHGVAVNLMAKAFPKSKFTGIDNHEAAIREARTAAQDMGLSNAVYKVLDAAEIHGEKEFYRLFDYICAFDAIHDQSHPLEALKGIRYMLAPGGMFSMIDIKAGSNHADNIDHPMGPFLYTVSLMHCMPVGLNDNGSGLGMMWGQEKAEALLREAGFEHIELTEMEHDPFNLHYLCKAPLEHEGVT